MIEFIKQAAGREVANVACGSPCSEQLVSNSTARSFRKARFRLRTRFTIRMNSQFPGGAMAHGDQKITIVFVILADTPAEPDAGLLAAACFLRSE